MSRFVRDGMRENVRPLCRRRHQAMLPSNVSQPPQDAGWAQKQSRTVLPGYGNCELRPPRSIRVRAFPPRNECV
jgi:hypothetical protein